MSRLDSFIRRMEAQRDGLNAAAARIATIAGPVFELGLGNGRTYDHIREIVPGREIFVFERRPMAHASSMPEPDHLIEGDIDRTLPAALDEWRGRVALIHWDLGSGRPEIDDALMRHCTPVMAALLRPGGLLLSGLPADAPELAAAPPSGATSQGRCFLYRKKSANRGARTEKKTGRPLASCEPTGA